MSETQLDVRGIAKPDAYRVLKEQLDAICDGGCGTAAQSRQTVIVEDVRSFAGHISCDARSLSEIVVPVFDRRGRRRWLPSAGGTCIFTVKYCAGSGVS
jgi:hypothetical protein